MMNFTGRRQLKAGNHLNLYRGLRTKAGSLMGLNEVHFTRFDPLPSCHFSGCEVSFVKAMKDADRHVANRGLQLEAQASVSLDMCPACDALAPLSCEWTTIENRKANSAEDSRSNHMGSRHCRNLKADLWH